jgi:hypothetical protein
MNTQTVRPGSRGAIEEARHNADVSARNTSSQAWIVLNPTASTPGATQYFSFNTPTDALPTPDGTQYCGRVVYSDLHVGAASGDLFGVSVPQSCADAGLSRRRWAAAATCDILRSPTSRVPGHHVPKGNAT